LNDAPPGSNLNVLQDLCDAHYAILLGILAQSFSLGDKAGGILLEQARRQMFNLHETSNLLASKGVRVRFKLPSIPLPSQFTSSAAHAHLDALSSMFAKSVSMIKEVGGEEEKQVAARHEKVVNNLFDSIHKLIEDKMEND
jgi:hypothetical protein